MIKWGIEEAQLAAAGRDAQAPEVGVTRTFVEYSPYQTPKIHLLSIVAVSQGCRVVLTNTHYGPEGQRGKWADIIGLPQQREFTEMLYASLLVQSANEFQSREVQERMFAETSHPGHRIKWRNGFVLGYASAIGQRFRDREREVVSATGSALVLRDRDKMVASYMDDNYSKLGKLKAKAGGHAGRSSGHAAAQRADLGDPRVSATSRRPSLGG